MVDSINECIWQIQSMGALHQGYIKGWNKATSDASGGREHLVGADHLMVILCPHLIPLISFHSSQHPLISRHSPPHSSAMNISICLWVRATSPSTFVVSLDKRWFILKLMNNVIHLIANDLEGEGFNGGQGQWIQWICNPTPIHQP